MVDLELKRAVDLAGLKRFESRSDLADDLPVGVRMLDVWRRGEHGAVLLWVDRAVDIWGFGYANLHLVEGGRVDGHWRVSGGCGWATFAAAQYIADDGIALRRHGGGSGGRVRFTLALASPDVSSIELRTDRGTSSRSPGDDGFCLFGLINGDPITYARAFDVDGRPLGDELLL